jgi:hypothetical protein
MHSICCCDALNFATELEHMPSMKHIKKEQTTHFFIFLNVKSSHSLKHRIIFSFIWLLIVRQKVNFAFKWIELPESMIVYDPSLMQNIKMISN